MSAPTKNGAAAYPKKVPDGAIWVEGEHYNHTLDADKLNAPVEKDDKCGIKMTPTPRGLEMELTGKRRKFVTCENGRPVEFYFWCERVGSSPNPA